ncbi:XK-related protein 8-like [Crassostrea angulata]|uniref:XK-related protein 8-like n=1 Tax=Magallana angulata TaxID=2784310 RepID=UPI0022B1A265|nr:XK-related protein 8-like [Crassostrea angulata]
MWLLPRRYYSRRAIKQKLQIFISYTEIQRSFAIASSFAGLSWSVTSNLRISSATSGLKANSICGAVGYFLWRVFEIGPRITAIVMLLPVDSHGLYIIFRSLVHWFIMLTMAFLRHVKVYDEPVHNIMFIVFISFVQIISYMNLSHGKSRLFAITYYTLFYVENVVMVLLFALWTDIDKSSWIFIVAVCVASSGTLFCTLFMVMYFKLCHPKVSHK